MNCEYQDYPDHHSDSGRCQEKEHGAASEWAEFPDVSQATHAHDHRADDQWHHHDKQGLQKQLAEELNRSANFRCEPSDKNPNRDSKKNG